MEDFEHIGIFFIPPVRLWMEAVRNNDRHKYEHTAAERGCNVKYECEKPE